MHLQAHLLNAHTAVGETVILVIVRALNILAQCKLDEGIPIGKLHVFGTGTPAQFDQLCLPPMVLQLPCSI